MDDERATAATADAQAFVRLLSRPLSSALDADGRAVLVSRLATAFEDLYSDVPARRIAVVREVVAGTGRCAPDELDLIAFITRQVLTETGSPPAATTLLDQALDRLRRIEDPSP